jgi:Tfp pilus assembly protein PilE
MAFLYDNLTATVIAMTVVLILAAIQVRATQQNVAQTSRHIVKSQAQTLASWMEDDLEQLGENMTADGIAFDAPQKEDSEWAPGGWITREFSFYRDSSDVRLETRYEIDSTGTQTVDGETRTLYELKRYHEGFQDGESSPTLGYFDVDMLDRNADVIANPATNRDSVRSIRVQFSVVAPYQNREMSIRVVHFGSVVVRNPLAED